MKPNIAAFSAPKALLTLALVAAGLLAGVSHAQQVYRIVGADGKVTFSDRAPEVSGANVSATAANAAVGQANARLPYELRQVAGKYPVTLYTGDSCAPCDAGRAMLTRRGIPFAERTVTTADDSQSLQRMSGETTLPFATIGSQQLKGFSDAEWTQYLSAAGYPTTSVLPASYRAPAPTPLVSVATAPAAPATAPGATAGTAITNRPTRPLVRPDPQRDGRNPAGIQF